MFQGLRWRLLLSYLTIMAAILAVFGSGNPFEGVIILGLAFALVGFFFDIFNFYFYRYQGLRS